MYPNKVIPSPARSAGLPEEKNNSRSLNMIKDGSTGDLALPAVPPPQSVDLTRILTVSGVVETTSQKSPMFGMSPRERGEMSNITNPMRPLNA